MKYTLITGASQGMGLHMAEECASLNRNVLLVSLPNENLEKLSLELKKKYIIQSDYLEIDLTEKGSSKNIFDWVKKNNYSIDFLINNAGFGV